MGPGASAFIWPYADLQFGFLDVELGYDHLHALAAQGRHRAVRALLRKGMNPNAPRQDGALGAREDEQGDSPMLCAARGLLGNKDRPEHVKTLEELLHFGGRINQPNRLNQTPLYVACERDLPLVATWLLQHGADINANCKTGVTPLMCAYRNQNTALVTLLLEKGAIVIRPPASFSCIQFPELSDEFSTPEAPVEDKNATSLRVQLQQQVDCEAERRAQLLEDAEELQRLEDQRVYREQLAKEGAKRKARRRRQREEAQQRRNLPTMKALAPATDLVETGDEERCCESRSKGDTLLLWEKKVAVMPRARSATSGRPNWVACQNHSAQNVDATRSKMQHELLHQCEQLYHSLEIERTRHMRMRSIATAPANASANGLPPTRSVRPETAPL